MIFFVYAETTKQLDYYQGMDATYKGYQCSDGTNEYWSPRPNHDDGFRVVA